MPIRKREKYATWLGLTGFLIVVRGKGKGSHRTRPHKASNGRKAKGFQWSRQHRVPNCRKGKWEKVPAGAGHRGL